jgi:hypothetical protein
VSREGVPWHLKEPKLVITVTTLISNEWKLNMQRKPTVAALWHRNSVSWYRIYDTEQTKVSIVKGSKFNMKNTLWAQAGDVDATDENSVLQQCENALLITIGNT